MNNSSNSRSSQPPRAIRAGLSVQELKAMTAARIAQSGDPQPRIQQYNPATSYQTANPQQLQAAGITPIVINDRSRTLRNFRPNTLSTIELEPLQNTNHSNLPHPSSRNGISQLSPYHQQILPRRSPPQDHLLAHRDRDGYYNSNTSTHFESSDNHSWNQRSPIRDFPSSHNERDNALFGGGKTRNDSVFGNFEPHTDLTPRTPGGLLPSLNTSPRYVRGPEVRSPATGERPIAERYFIPDEESEQYSMDSLFSALNLGQSTTNSDNLAFGSKKVPLSRALSNPVIQSEGGSFTLPNAGSHVISSSFLPAVSPSSPVQSGTIYPQSQVDNGRSEHLTFEEPVESNSKFLEPARFPFKKSKTAPKLGIISSGMNSPIDSPSLKIFARKHAGHPVNLSPLRDRTSLDSNFLASEVAEAVLDTPSTGSTPLGRKFFPQDAIPSLRKGFSNSLIQPIDLTPDSSKGYFANGSFYGANAVRDDRLEWSISDPAEDNHNQFHVSNQCESDDTQDRAMERSLRPDSTENRLHRRVIHAGTNRNLPSLD